MVALRIGALAAIFLSITPEVTAFAPTSFKLAPPSFVVAQERLVRLNVQQWGENNDDVFDPKLVSKRSIPSWSMAAVPVLTTLFLSLPAEAAAGGAPFPSAVAAYVHCVSLLLMSACVAVERFTVKPGMSQEEQELLSITDTVYGVVSVALFVSGYYRLTEYGKGWDFYAHEPVFWLKIALVGVLGATSLFPTTKIIQRALEKQKTGQYPEMSDKLACRMQTLMNAEMTALVSIPLSATVMSRGIGYNADIPWQAEAFLAIGVFVGLSYKYVKEALDFEEDDVLLASADE
jgi:putative membrane protein